MLNYVRKLGNLHIFPKTSRSVFKLRNNQSQGFTTHAKDLRNITHQKRNGKSIDVKFWYHKTKQLHLTGDETLRAVQFRGRPRTTLPASMEERVSQTLEEYVGKSKEETKWRKTALQEEQNTKKRKARKYTTKLRKNCVSLVAHTGAEFLS